MKYSANVIAFKSRVKSAMRDDLAWDMLELMSDNLCINVKVSKEVVHVLLQELKIYKLSNPCYLDSNSEIASDSIDIKIEVEEETCLENESSDPLNHFSTPESKLFSENNVLKEEQVSESLEFFETSVGNDPVLDAVKSEALDDTSIEDSNSEHLDKSEENFKTDQNNESDCNGGKKRFKCHICSKEYTRRLNLRIHKKNVHGIKTEIFACDPCGKTFANRSLQTTHFNKYHKKVDRPFQCDQCDKTFTKEDLLENHVNMMHSHFQCDQCEYACKEKYTLKRHFKAIHENIRDHVCDQCGKRFRLTQGLKRHIGLIHDKNMCNICYEIFPNVQEHKDQAHENIPCDQCGKTFDKRQLKDHIRNVHHPQACSECDKTFAKSHTLNEHVMRVHKGMAQFVCKLCDKTFCHAAALKKHANTRRCRKYAKLKSLSKIN